MSRRVLEQFGQTELNRRTRFDRCEKREIGACIVFLSSSCAREKRQAAENESKWNDVSFRACFYGSKFFGMNTNNTRPFVIGVSRAVASNRLEWRNVEQALLLTPIDCNCNYEMLIGPDSASSSSAAMKVNRKKWKNERRNTKRKLHARGSLLISFTHGKQRTIPINK